MDNEIPLFEEYKLLSSYFEKTASIQFALFPAFVTISLGVLAYKIPNPDPSIISLLFQSFLFFLLIFLGFSHTMLHNYGLKLIDLELRINKILKLDELNQFSYFTQMIGQGFKSIPYFLLYTTCLTILLFIAYIITEYFCWLYMTKNNFSIELSICITILKSIFVIFLLIPLFFIDQKIKKEKDELFKKYGKVS